MARKELKGRAKEAVGPLAGNRKLRLEGKADQASAFAKRTGDKVTQRATKLAEKLRATELAEKLRVTELTEKLKGSG